MKTFWSSQMSQQKAQEIAKKQSEKFGVPFCCTHMHAGWAIRPCVDKETVASDFGLDKVLAVLGNQFNIKSFIMIADETGLSLKDVIAVGKFINTGINREKNIVLQNVILDIERSGHIIGMHIWR